MDEMVSGLSRGGSLKRITAALGAGVVLLDSEGRIAWMDRRTRARLNGSMEEFAAALQSLEAQDGITCAVYPAEVTINGEAAIVCLLKQLDEPAQPGFDLVTALEAAMADTSWLTRTVIAKVKALLQAKRPAPRTADLDLLTDRERDVLALICQGCSDAQMGAALNLSQNTVRNHIASLYRKIGVNRRTAAVIWARERGITPQDALGARARTRAPKNRVLE